MRLKDRVALITGGDSGIGLATAQRFVAEGARVAILGLTKEHVEEAAEKLSQQGGDILPLVADVSDANQVQSAVRQIDERWGQLDILFVNAGINGVWAPIDVLKVEEWDQVISVNLRGAFLTLKYTVPLLRRQGGSVIINSSVNGTRIFSNTGATAYASTKAAQLAMMQMLAIELAKHRIRVNAICPGEIATPIQEKTETRKVEREKEPVKFKSGRIPLTRGESGQPQQVADLVLFLASDESDHITGTPIWIDGGESLLQG